MEEGSDRGWTRVEWRRAPPPEFHVCLSPSKNKCVPSLHTIIHLIINYTYILYLLLEHRIRFISHHSGLEAKKQCKIVDGCGIGCPKNKIDFFKTSRYCWPLFSIFWLTVLCTWPFTTLTKIQNTVCIYTCVLYKKECRPILIITYYILWIFYFDVRFLSFKNPTSLTVILLCWFLCNLSCQNTFEYSFTLLTKPICVWLLWPFPNILTFNILSK